MNESWGSLPATPLLQRGLGSERLGPSESAQPTPGVCFGATPDTCIKEPAVSRLLLPHPSLRLSLNPGLPGCWSPADTPELSRVLSQAKASAGGGQEEPPDSLFRVLPGGSPALLRLPKPPVGGPRPRGTLRGTGSRAPRARWPNPREQREGTVLSRGGPLPMGTSGKGTAAFVLQGLGEAALPRRSAGGAGAPGLLTFARGVWKAASSCLLGRG